LARVPTFAAALLVARAAGADPLAVVNALRLEGCAGQRAVASTLRPSEALDDVARELSRSGRLAEAIGRVGYPAARSTSIEIRGATDDAAIRQMLDDRYCMPVSHPQFTEIGVFRSGNETWIVLAGRSAQPAIEDSAAVARRVLDLVNAARAAPRRCGRRTHDAAPPLTLSPRLGEVALRHAHDMARQGALEHRGSDGSQPAERVTRAGYRWRAAGENIAAGQSDADAVVAAWLASPGHCVNIMGAQFTEMGVAFALAPSGDPSIYWAQVFATPQ
jgi:uncharacterized protein YkwD